MWIEEYSWSDALFMTIITISTVGYEEVKPLTEGGRLFTIALIIISFGTFAYALSAISSYIIDGEFRRHYSILKRAKKIQKLENHIIICGYGRNGRQIVKELEDAGQQFIVIDNADNAIEKLSQSAKRFYIAGDATEDKTLINAGIKRARALVTTLPEDADNVFVVLTAREMNDKLLIISRASIDSSYKKLKMAGADNVVMPDKVGGTHMASMVMKPDVVEFFNQITGQNTNISIEEITYESLPGEFKNRSIEELEIRKRSGANIVGLLNPEGKYVLNPAPDTIISEGSKIFVLGMKNQIEKLKSWD